MKRYFESIHVNDIYSCEQCDYKENQKFNLKPRIVSIHDNVTYSCDQCEYKAKRKDKLKPTFNISMGMSLTPVVNVSIKQNGKIA